MICPNCFAEIPETSLICPVCGTDFLAGKGPPATAPAPAPGEAPLPAPTGAPAAAAAVATHPPHPHQGPLPSFAPLTEVHPVRTRILVALAALAVVAGVIWGALSWRAAQARQAAVWSSPPVAAAGLPTGGLAHTCVLTEAGRVLCWGSTELGQLGDTSAAPAGAPCTVCSNAMFGQVDAGDTHTCGRTADGRVLCWGSNLFGQLGVSVSTVCLTPHGRIPCAAVPVQVPLESALQVAAGGDFSCALTADSLAWCWGSNYRGQLGVERMAPGQRIARVAGGLRFATLAAGRQHACGLTSDGTIRCWGANASGQLGTTARIKLCGPTRQTLEPCSPAPVAVASNLRFRALAAGVEHTCALAGDGRVFCWGANGAGQLGTGSNEPSRVPAQIAGEQRYQAIAAGADFACAIAGDGAVWCWGANARGQLGNRDSIASATPVRARLTLPALSVGAGAAHACAVTEGKRVFCWGAGDEGQLGNRRVVDSRVPVQAGSPARSASR